MALSVSLSVFADTTGDESSEQTRRHRALYRMKDEGSQTPWICSYRRGLTSLKEHSCNYSVPNYLEFCGLLVVSDIPDADLGSLVPEELKGTLSYLLRWDPLKSLNGTLQEAVQCFKGSCKEEIVGLCEVPTTEIIWVDDDMAEVARRGYIPMAVTLVVELPLSVEEDLELSEELIGIKRPSELAAPLGTLVTEFLHGDLIQMLDASNENLAIEVNEIVRSKAGNGNEDGSHARGSFGGKSGYDRHACVSVVPDEEEGVMDPTVDIKLVWQTTCVVPEGLVSQDPTEELYEILIQSCRHLVKLVCGSTETCRDVQLAVKAQKKEQKKTETKAASNKNKPKGKNSSKGGKGKGPARGAKKPQVPTKTESTDLELLKSWGPVTVGILNSNQVVDLDVTLEKSTGNLKVRASEHSRKVEQAPLEKIRVHSILKCFVSPDYKTLSTLPFGGATLSLLDLAGGERSIGDILAPIHPGNHIKLLVDAKDLCDKSVLIEPHPSAAMFPQWMSNKTSTAHIIKGFYQYYHYLQNGINDSGWGCCYRSIQMVVSWYLLQNYTVKPVPMHAQIQAYLKERDPSHKELVVGSSTWIGTVEAGYFINWYLNYNTKTVYLSNINELRNYHGVIANHFRGVGTPIIMGAGMFAYVIVGICIETQGAGVAYLIADPHYAGDDNVKNLRAKGAIAWKKLDFIAKAANSGFINLCCPQLEPYQE